MTESSEWQRIGEVPVDTGRLVLVDPMNADDVGRHEDELAARYEAEEEMEETEAEVPPVMTYKLITNEHGVAVALMSIRVWATDSIRSRRVSRKRKAPFGSPRFGSGSCPTR
jgi:hypothetical protein